MSNGIRIPGWRLRPEGYSRIATLAAATFWLLTASPGSCLDVRDFGARPDDSQDDTSAFIAAFDSLTNSTHKEIIIPRGRYHLRSDGNPGHPASLMRISGLSGVRVRGKGAELIMSGGSGVFTFTYCKDVQIEGLTIDWDRPPFSQGTVTESTTNTFDVQVEPGYPMLTNEPVEAFMTYDAKTRLPAGGDLDVYHSVERTELLAPQLLRVHLNRSIPVNKGAYLVLRHKVYGAVGLHFVRCQDVKVRRTTVHSVPGMGLVANGTTNVYLSEFDVRVRKGADRLMTATADATHFAGCKGTVRIENCLFERMGDDGANIKSGLYLTVLERVNDRTFRTQHNLKMVDAPDPGDVLEICSTNDLIPFAKAIVSKVEVGPRPEHIHTVTFNAPVDPALKPGDVLGNSSRVPRLRMKNCTVRANRARGVLCQTRSAVIEDCTFENCTGPGVMVLTEVVHFFESIGTRDVLVRGCLFRGCNRGAAAAEGSLCALAWLQGFAHPQKPGVHRNLEISRNRILDGGGAGIFASSIDGLKIIGNKVRNVGLPPTPEGRLHSIRIQHCSRVLLKDNDIPVDARIVEPLLIINSERTK